MLDLVEINGIARGVICRDLVTGKFEAHAADAVLLATGGYGNVYHLSTNAKASNVTAAWRCHKRGAFFANPCYTQIHPTCIPVSGDYQSKLTLMSESLRNDGRVWVPKNQGDKRPPNQIPEAERDYYLERRYPTYANMVARDVASRAAKERCDAGYGVGESGMAVYLDFNDAIRRKGLETIKAEYSNLFEMYNRITDEDPYKTPMRIYPAVHYTMGGLWVDYHLESTIPGLFVLGEANFSDHGANRLGASALMQGLADGYFIAPYTVSNHLASRTKELAAVTEAHPLFADRLKEAQGRSQKLIDIKGSRTPDEIHQQLGRLMWEYCGMSRSEKGLTTAIEKIRELRAEFWKSIKILGTGEQLNQSLEHAGRLSDFLEFGELLAQDALQRNESCGGHFREEYQTPDNDTLRDDANYAYSAAWQYQGENNPETLHKEPLTFTEVPLVQRSYK